MSSITFTNQPSLAELQQTYDVYVKALRLLVADGVKESEARKSVCWKRLSSLHDALPNVYYGTPSVDVFGASEGVEVTMYRSRSAKNYLHIDVY